jgi:hypothetical protein
MTLNSQYSMDGSGYYARYTSKPEGVRQSAGASAAQAQNIIGSAFNELVYGRQLPGLDELLTRSEGLNPSSSGAQQLQSQLAGLFGQQAGQLGQLRAYEFSLVNAVRYLNNVALGLYTAGQRVDPNSQTGQIIQERIAKVSETEQRLNDQFQVALMFDPTHGGESRI